MKTLNEKNRRRSQTFARAHTTLSVVVIFFAACMWCVRTFVRAFRQPERYKTAAALGDAFFELKISNTLCTVF